MNSETARRLDEYYQEVSTIILSRQNATTGLIPASVAITSHGDYRDAWVRDNVYTILCVWGLALAYRKYDDTNGRAFELEHATVKCMRGLLFAMMSQSKKVEKFKNTQSLLDSLHAKFNTATGQSVVGDNEWGHLQIDATSIFLLFLAQMTSSGLRIIYTMDEVNFVQNLVFYIERCYRTPDYGIWERGNKINHGMPELNSSSIGMVVAALQAMNGINLFGPKGGTASTIHVLPDEITRNYTTLHSALPRESASKEVDAALLSVISFPAFAVDDPELAKHTREQIVKKLGGKYGFKRFLRDGHQTEVENTSRLHYEPHELQIFENIESEWPLFFTYMILDGLFREDQAQVDEYLNKMKPLLVDSNDLLTKEPVSTDQPPKSPLLTVNTAPDEPTSPASYIVSNALKLHSGTRKRSLKLIPELFKVPLDAVEKEKLNPGSQVRIPNENIPLVWAQSLYTLGRLISDDLLACADLDPLGRRFNLTKGRYNRGDTVVQMVLISEDFELQQKLNTYGLETQTIESCDPYIISRPSALRDAYTALGFNSKIGLTGRPKRPIGSLSTCKLYKFNGKTYCFRPHFMDREEFYLVSDNNLLCSFIEQEVAFVKNHWMNPGRPTMIIMLTHEMIGNTLVGGQTFKSKSRWYNSQNSKRNLLNFMMSLKSGFCNGTRVKLGLLSDMVTTSCISNLDFLFSSAERDLAVEQWETILRGEIYAPIIESTRLPPSEYISDSHELKLDVDSFGRRKLRRNSSMDLANVPKSPLASSWFEDTFKLKDHQETSSGRDSPIIRVEASPRPFDNSNEDVSCPNSPDSNIHYEAPDYNIPVSRDILDKPRIDTENILVLTLNDETHFKDAVELLEKSANIFDQIDILHYMVSCKGLDYDIPGLSTIKALLEEVYLKGMHLGQWSVVRQAAGLLHKFVNSLTINVSDLLIRQHPVTVGYGPKEFFISSPMNPSALQEIIYKQCKSDVREPPLVQEVLTYLGSFVRSDPSLFDGISRVRTHFFIIAMREEISVTRSCDEEEAVEYLMQMSPFELKTLLGQVLESHEQCAFPVTTAVRSNRNRSTVTIQAAEGKRHRKLEKKQGEISEDLSGIQCSVVVQSAGYLSGNFATIEIYKNDNPLQLKLTPSRGFNLVIIDPIEGEVVEESSYDTHTSGEESNELAKCLEWVDPGYLIVLVVKDDASEHLTDAARSTIESLGAQKIKNLKYRDSYFLIAIKGSSTDVVEGLSPSKDGPTELITKVIDWAGSKRQLLSVATHTTPSSLMLILPSQGRWLRRRKNDGALNRVPTEFYPKVWKVLSKVEGITVHNIQKLPSQPTVSEKTPEELNFALEVETFLDIIRDPAERQIAVECLVVIFFIMHNNAGLALRHEYLDLVKLIRCANYLHWCDWVGSRTIQDLQFLVNGNTNWTLYNSDVIANSTSDLIQADPSHSHLANSGRKFSWIANSPQTSSASLFASVDQFLGSAIPQISPIIARKQPRTGSDSSTHSGETTESQGDTPNDSGVATSDIVKTTVDTAAAILNATGCLPSAISAMVSLPDSTVSAAAAASVAIAESVIDTHSCAANECSICITAPSLSGESEDNDRASNSEGIQLLTELHKELMGTTAFEKHERLARRLFFDLPQDGSAGTMSYLACSCVKLAFKAPQK